jgi:predicted site-specific integrase-resolvase
MPNYVPPRVAANKLGVSTKTLERWYAAGKIKAIETPGGQKRYDCDSIAVGVSSERGTVVYARVSSRSQKPDLDSQIEFLKSKYPEAELITDIGSGLNFKRKGLQTLLERVLSDDVGLLVVAHKDRLCRFGFDLVAWICNRQNCEILVLNQAHLSPEREMVEDIFAIIHVFSCRLYGLRKYKKAVREDPELPSLSGESPESTVEAMGGSSVQVGEPEHVRRHEFRFLENEEGRDSPTRKTKLY